MCIIGNILKIGANLIDGENKQTKSLKPVTVDLEQPSFYHAPDRTTLRGVLHHIKLKLAYRLYKVLIQKFASTESDSIPMIEIGSGPGVLQKYFDEWFPTTSFYGFDYDIRLLNQTRRNLKNAKLIQGNAELLPLKSELFSGVISLHLIEHLFHPELYLDEVYRILHPQGIFIMATPNPSGLGARLMKNKWSGWRVDHVSLQTPEQWKLLLQSKKFTPLYEGTTFLTGIPIFRKFPLVFLNWGIIFVFGTLPWELGEAYISVWRKT